MSGTKGKIAKYALLPGFIPRIFALVTSGFSHLAYYIAMVYAMVRLLPRDHPYLNYENFGQYGVRHVIAQAANNLTYTRKNLDQIIIFYTILVGLILMAIQIGLLTVALITQQEAFAAAATSYNNLSGFDLKALLTNPNSTTGSPGPEQDIAFIVLDKVFGMVGIFDSCISTGIACVDNAGNPLTTTIAAYPYPFHLALHQMLRFYSLGIMFVGAWVIIYYVITVAAETASTGTPFGQRFNKGWVPIRIVLFFGLLIPLNIDSTNEGLNGAQIITLWTAKHGSNFATNTWGYFNINLTETYMGQQETLIATPHIPELGSLNQFILTAKTCVFAEGMSVGERSERSIQPYLVRGTPPAYNAAAASPLPGAPNTLEFMSTDYDAALAFSLNGNITMRIGELATDTDGDGVLDDYNTYNGNVFPYCGEIVFHATDVSEPGSYSINKAYYAMVQDMWNNTQSTDIAQCLTENTLNIAGNHAPTCTDMPSIDYVQNQNSTYKAELETIVMGGIAEQRTNGEFGVPTEVLAKGWAGAAIWFNRIAEMNGAVTSATFNIPRPHKWPDVLEMAYHKRIQQDVDVSGTSRFSLELSDGRLLELPENRQLIHPPIYKAYTFWEADGISSSSQTQVTGNIVIDFINATLGTSGLFSMRENTNVHPLAQLTSLGKGMMEATIRNTVYAFGGTIAGGLGGMLDPFFAQLGDSASKFFFSMVTVSIGMSVILYYVLPFLPFIYFLFAFSGWIKSIFEAIVAMPLWALAHIRIDGDGLSGPAASNGYFLLLEVFLRPVLILFGLVASISVFSALVSVLNNVFDLVVNNVGGFDTEASVTSTDLLEMMRNPIDQFFFTALYAILCYMIGLSCFKLIDLIPNNILRWAGNSTATFQENAGDPASAMTGQIYKGTMLVSNQVKGTTQGNLALLVG